MQFKSFRSGTLSLTQLVASMCITWQAVADPPDIRYKYTAHILHIHKSFCAPNHAPKPSQCRIRVSHAELLHAVEKV